MAYTAGNLSLLTGAPGDLVYKYDAGSDSMATVITAGYFNNSDDDLNLVADDRIMCGCTDGNMWVKVSAVSSGSVTVQFAGGDLPLNAVAATASGALSVGYTELGSGTASAFVLPAPYAGSHIAIFKSGTVTSNKTVITDGTGTTLNVQGDRTITLGQEGENFHLQGTSTTRWRMISMTNYGTNVPGLTS